MMRRKGINCIVTACQIKLESRARLAAHPCRLPVPTFALGLEETVQHSKCIQTQRKLINYLQVYFAWEFMKQMEWRL